MKIRLGSLLYDFNITLNTAKERLRKLGKEYTIHTVVSDEEIQILSSYSDSHIGKKEKKEKKKTKKKKPKTNNKPPQKPISLKKQMTKGRSFVSCATDFKIYQKEIEGFADIYKEMKRVFGNDVVVSKLPLFKTKVFKGVNVLYKYHYYALNGRKALIKHMCIATWLACIFSEAVNQEIITKADYRQIYKSHIWKYIQSMKKKPRRPRRRPWISVVSVPFGGMNRR